MSTADPVRRQLARALNWKDARVDFAGAVTRFPPELRGRLPEGLPWSGWQLLEHMRLCQRDILDFCLDPEYQEPRWPEDYWPPGPEPPDGDAWGRSVEGFLRDLRDMQKMVEDPSVDLLAVTPTGTEGQTYLRAALLLVDHNAYHIGQVVALRRLLGIWPPDR